MKIRDLAQKLITGIKEIVSGIDLQVLASIGLYPHTVQNAGKGAKLELKAKNLSPVERKRLPTIDITIEDPDEARRKIKIPLLHSRSEEVVKALR